MSDDTTFQCSKESLREMNALLSAHALREKKNMTRAEFFKLLLDNWRMNHEQV